MEGQGSRQEFSPEMFPPNARDDFTKWRLQGGDIKESIEHQLRGDFLEKKTKNIGTEEKPEWIVIEEWVSDEHAKIMNESGVRRVSAVSTFMINKATALSSVSEEHILISCRNIEISIGRLIYDNWEDFNVRTNPSSIINILMELIYFHLMRAKGGGERESLTKAETTTRLIREGLQSEQTGGRRGMFPFGGKKNE